MIHPVVAAAVQVFQVAYTDLVGESRERKYTPARQAVIYALTQKGMTLQAAAFAIGRNNHSTAIYAAEQAVERMERDARYAAQVQALCDVPIETPLESAARALLTDERVLVIGQQVIVPLDVYEALKRAMEGR